MSESVWDYPRPPRIEQSRRHVKVSFGGELIADSRACLRVLETSHPPVYYIPPVDVRGDLLQPTTTRTWCEFKGTAHYWRINVGNHLSEDAAWSYPHPAPEYELLRDYVAFYPNRVDRCTVDELEVQPQPGDFYGGWITPDIRGPFKGGPGTRGW